MGNIVSGNELISRLELGDVFGRDVYSGFFFEIIDQNSLFFPCVGLTIPLITSESGSKLGKTAGNAIWITSSKTSPYELYQFFMRMKDSEIEQMLKLFTFFSTEEISQIMEKQTVYRHMYSYI